MKTLLLVQLFSLAVILSMQWLLYLKLEIEASRRHVELLHLLQGILEGLARRP